MAQHLIETSRIQLLLDPIGSRWSLTLRRADSPLIENAAWGAVVRRAGRSRARSGESRATQVEAREIIGPGGDQANALVAESDLDSEGVRLRAEFALIEAHPALFMRMTLMNESPGEVLGERLVFGRAGPAALGQDRGMGLFAPQRANKQGVAPGAVRLSQDPVELSCYINGWQSWSFAGALGERDRQPIPRLGPVEVPMHAGAAHPWPRGRGHFRSDMFAHLRGAAPGGAITAGFLSQKEQFGCVETWLDRLAPSLDIWADLEDMAIAPGRAVVSDWLFVGLATTGGEGLLEGYLDLVARENGARATREPPVGWCSWYHYFTRVTDDDLRKNTEAAATLRRRVPLAMIQLDDGFEANPGDWYDRNARFPRPMREVADTIRRQGFVPGLWLAPLLAKPTAAITKKEPRWWLRGRWGRPASAGLVWFKWGRGLDVTQPAALAHAKQVIRTAAHEWGFSYLKLDFLYASALRARRTDRTVTRAQALRRALEGLREAAGEQTFLLGCGCPVGSGIGIFDAMRIGPDVDFRWDPTFRPISAWIHSDPAFPSARNAIRNTLSRAMLHRRWWWNDPDCMLARDNDTQLTLDERRSLATAIGMTGGALLISDDLAQLSEDSLQLIQVLLPANTRAARILDWDRTAWPETAVLDCHGAAGEWLVVARFNWTSQPTSVVLDLRRMGLPEDVEGLSFWDCRPLRSAAARIDLGTIPAHGVALAALRSPKGGPAYLGSSLHFTQGNEVAAMHVAARSLTLDLDLGRQAEGSIFVRLPADPGDVRLDGRPLEATPLDAAIFRINVTFDTRGHLGIGW